MGAGNQVGGTLMGAGSGAATGALLGSVVPGIGTGIGAGVGGLLGGVAGFFGSKGTDDSANAQRAALDAAMQRLSAFSTQDAARRADDLQQTMAFYGPADAYLKSIYAQPAPGAAGPPMPTGAPPTAGPPPGQYPKPPMPQRMRLPLG